MAEPTDTRRRKWREFASEHDMGMVLFRWLRKEGWDVWQEVSMGYGDCCADLVARKDGRYLLIECKLSLSLAVITQALRWKRAKMAHWIAVAHGEGRYSRRRDGGRDICHELGIEILTVGGESKYQPDGVVSWYGKREQPTEPEWLEHLTQRLHDGLNEYGKVGTGLHYTVFKETCASLVDYITAHPGCTMKAAVAGIVHHYSTPASARNSLGKWIGEKGLERVYWDKRGRLRVRGEGGAGT